MADLITCSINSLHAHTIQITNTSMQSDAVLVSAKIGYGVSGKPAGEVSVEGLEDDEAVAEAAVALILAVEKAYAPTVGTVVDKEKPSSGEPPAGIIDF